MIVKKGPYRWLKHPNYVVVAIELMFIPLLFNAFITAILFTCLNGWMMMVRIQTEEKALNQYLLINIENHYQLCYTFINDKHSQS